MRVFAPAFIVALALLSGCNSVRHFSGFTLHDDALYVAGVTPIRQDGDHSCGPTCVAAVAAHCGVPLGDFDAKIPRAHGDATADDLVRFARNVGLEGFAYRGSMADLEENLRAGRPLIVMIPMPLIGGGIEAGIVFSVWNEIGPRPAHWVVVTGLLGERSVLVDDPASGPLVIRRPEFEAWWARSDHLCVLIVPKEPAAAVAASAAPR